MASEVDYSSIGEFVDLNSVASEVDYSSREILLDSKNALQLDERIAVEVMQSEHNPQTVIEESGDLLAHTGLIKFTKRNGVDSPQVYVPASVSRSIKLNDETAFWISKPPKNHPNQKRYIRVDDAYFKSRGTGSRSVPIKATFEMRDRDPIEITSGLRQTSSKRGLAHTFLGITNVELNMIFKTWEGLVEPICDIKLNPFYLSDLVDGFKIVSRILKSGKVELPNYLQRLSESRDSSAYSNLWKVSEIEFGGIEEIMGTRRPKKLFPAKWKVGPVPQNEFFGDCLLYDLGNSGILETKDDNQITFEPGTNLILTLHSLETDNGI